MVKRSRLLSILLTALMCVFCIFTGACNAAPEKIKDGVSIELVVDEEQEILVADYITANGYEVEVSVDNDNVTAVLADGKITLTAVEKGDSVLTVSCEEIVVTFSVTVNAKTFSVTVDGTKVGDFEDGSEYELPAYAGQLDGNHEFLGWIVDGDSENLKQPTDKVTVQANVVVTAKVESKAAVLVKAEDEIVLTVASQEKGEMTLNVADYITTYGREVTVESSASGIATAVLEDGAVTVTAVAQGNATVTIACGELSAIISVTVNPETVIPTVKNGSIAIDLFTQTTGSYTTVVQSNPTQMTFAYALATQNSKASVDANGTVTYTADVVETVTLTVNVVATNPYDNIPYNLSFTVEVVVTDTTPSAPTFEDKALSYDLYETQEGVALGDVLKAEDGNFTYVYKVNGDEIDGSYKFTQTATVEVAYTYKGNTSKSGTTSFTVTVTTEDTTPTVKAAEVVAESVIDIFNAPSIDLSANVTNLNNVKGYKVNGETSNISEGVFSVADNGYSETATSVTFTVTVINTKDAEITYTYTVQIINTQKYRVENGSFESGNLDGWTVTDGMGNVVDYAEYWEGISYQKEGNYFFHGHENKGEGEFVLQSGRFVVGGSGWITFQMGAAAHLEHQYVEVVSATDSRVIARVTNVAFADNGGFNNDPDAGNRNKVSGLTLMKYKLNLSSVKGEEVYIRVVDKWAEGGFGMILFDNLVSYVPNAESISADYADATSACFAPVAAQIDLKDSNTATVVPAMKSLGVSSLTYTYEGAVADNASGLTVNGLTVTASKSGVYTVNYTVKCGDVAVATFDATVTVSNTTELPTFENVEKTFEASDWSTDAAKEIALPADGDRFAYSFSANVGMVEGRTLFYTPMASGEVVITVTVTLTDKNYTVEDLETVTFSVTLVFKEEGIMVPTQTPADEHYDVFDLDDKEELTVSFDSEKYIVVPANKVDSTSYSVTMSVNGGAVESVQLSNNGYAIKLENLTDVATKYTFNVTAVCDEQSVSYTLNVYLVDSTAYRLVNGGFESGITGWEVYGDDKGDVGAVSGESNYWLNDPDSAAGFEFRKDGEKMFSAYAPGIKEEAVGMLKSSTFVVSTNRIITFKLGAAMHDVFVDVVDAQTGVIYARYNNPAWSSDKPNACALHAYKAVLPEEAAGKTVYIRVVDNATKEYGLFFCDSFVTYYAQEPLEGFMDAGKIDAPATVYDIVNGGFETGNLDGWRLLMDEIGVVTNASGFWQDNISYGKEGDYLFTGVESFGADTFREGRKGMLVSSWFVLKSGSYLSFKVGGGKSHDMFISVVDVLTGNVIVLRNEAFQDAVLKDHYFKNEGADMLCYIKVMDFETSDWGCFALDSFKTVDTQPTGVAAVDHASEYANVVNGSFETGNLESWTVEEQGTLGYVLETETAEGWYQTNESVKDGKYLFTFWNGVTNIEGSTGKLRSKLFVLEKNGIITFRFGAARNPNVYINLCNAEGEVIATFRNGAHEKPTLMNYYYYQAALAQDTACYFEIVDNATDDYGCLVLDDFRANVAAIPEGAVPAHN